MSSRSSGFITGMCLLVSAVPASGAPPIGAELVASPVEAHATQAHAAIAPARPLARHALYLEVLGKGGLWGLGYERQLTRRLAVGGVGSYYILGGDHYTTLSPYLAAYPVIHARHRGFVHVGPQLVHRRTPSPVPEWDGMSTTAYGGELSAGYEYRHGILLRGYVMGAVGTRLVPGLGASAGWSW